MQYRTPGQQSRRTRHRNRKWQTLKAIPPTEILGTIRQTRGIIDTVRTHRLKPAPFRKALLGILSSLTVSITDTKTTCADKRQENQCSVILSKVIGSHISPRGFDLLTVPMIDLNSGLAAFSPDAACGSANENVLTSSLSAARHGDATAPGSWKEPRRERELLPPLASRGELRKDGNDADRKCAFLSSRASGWIDPMKMGIL